MSFGTVGAGGAVVDLGVLNTLSYLTNIYSGGGIIALNSIAFGAAVTNNYFLNKFWTFKDAGATVASGYAKFVTISLGGLLINTLGVYVLTTFVANFWGVSDALWLNAAKLVGLAGGAVWNFLGAKLFVFRA